MDLYGFIWEIKNVVYGKSHVGNPYIVNITYVFFEMVSRYNTHNNGHITSIWTMRFLNRSCMYITLILYT